nr:MAG TPA: ARS binding protein 2 [Caudoviricetes sp.]
MHLCYSVRAREWIRDQHFLHFLAKTPQVYFDQ